MKINIGAPQHKAYIAGPMTNMPYFNAEEFFRVECLLRGQGWVVHNPARHDVEEGVNFDLYPSGDLPLITASGFNFAKAMRWDLARICESDAIVCLSGWEKSTGGRIEIRVALACDLELWTVPTGLSVMHRIEPEYAKEVVYPDGQ